MSAREMKRVGICDGCKRPGIEPAQCCRIMILGYKWPVDERKSDFLRWLLSHEGVSCDGEGYELKLASRCRWLTDQGDCAIYETRPDICKEWPYDSSCLEDYPDCAYRFVDCEHL